MSIHKKCALAIALTSVWTVGIGYADQPASPNADVVAAVNQVNTSVQSIPQQTVDLLLPQLLPQFQSITLKQTEIWNKGVELQADQQFTGPSAVGTDFSLYSVWNQDLYSPAQQAMTAEPWAINVRQEFEKEMINFSLDKTQCDNGAVDMVKFPGAAQAIDYCNYNQGVNATYPQELAFLNADQYQVDDIPVVEGQIKEILSPLLVRGGINGTTGVPLTVLSQLQAVRTPQLSESGQVVGPSMMAALDQAVNQPLSPEWQNSMAKATTPDMLRAIGGMLAVNNYIELQRLKAEQQQLALMAVLMTKLNK